MTNRPYNEKDEKDEKEPRKHEEKTAEEKWRRDPLSAIIWAAILIWSGIVLLANNLGLLDFLSLRRFLPEGFEVFEPSVWSLIFIGAGLIVLAEAVIRLLVPAYRQPIAGTLILAAVLIGVGLGNTFGWNLIWAFVLIAIGVGLLLGGIGRRR